MIEFNINYIVLAISIILLIQIIRLDRNDTIENYTNYKNNTKTKSKHSNNNDNLPKKELEQRKIVPLPFDINYYNKNDSNKVFPPSSNYLKNFTKRKITYKIRNFDTSTTCIKNYTTSSLLNITPNEQLAFNTLVSEMITKLEEYKSSLSYLLTDILPNTNIAKGDIWLEGGMPHTHHNTIIFPYEMWYKLTQIPLDGIYKSSYAIEYFAKILIHELIHIEQRENPDKFLNLYKKWGFIKVEHMNGMEEPLYLNRLNPDGLDDHWLWKYPSKLTASSDRYNWIGAIHKPNAVNLRDVEYVAYSVILTSVKYASLDTTVPKIQLYQLEQYMEYFQLNNNNYHPNEIVAEYMSVLYSDTLDNQNIQKIQNNNKKNNIIYSKGFNTMMNIFNM